MRNAVPYCSTPDSSKLHPVQGSQQKLYSNVLLHKHDPYCFIIVISQIYLLPFLLNKTLYGTIIPSSK